MAQLLGQFIFKTEFGLNDPSWGTEVSQLAWSRVLDWDYFSVFSEQTTPLIFAFERKSLCKDLF